MAAPTYIHQRRLDRGLPADINAANTSDSIYYPAEPRQESDLYAPDGTIRRDISILVPSPISSKHNASDQASTCELGELIVILRNYLHNTLLTDKQSWEDIAEGTITSYLTFCQKENLSIGTTMALVYHLCFRSLYNRVPPEPFNLSWDSLRELTQKDDEQSMKKIVPDISGNGAHITHPYDLYPRRLWDLYTNRVIPTYLVQAQNGDIKIKFMAITHSWVQDLEHEISDINEYAWPVPLPKGVSLRKIRQDIFSQAPGLRYCWLDVLCNRQTGYSMDRKPDGSGHGDTPVSRAGDALGLQQDFGDPAHELRDKEWKLDIPTMGNIYQKAMFTLRYFNGLGRDFSDKGWDHQNHWLNRVWTLQESVGVMVDMTILAENDTRTSLSYAAGYGPLHIWGERNGEYKQMRDFVRDLERVVRDLEIDDRKNKRSIIALAQEMDRRHTREPADKIAGLSHLLNFDVLPTYETKDPEQAWARCLRHMPDAVKLELVFTCPVSCGVHWFPTWNQLLKCPPSRVKYTGPIAPTFQSRLASDSKPPVAIFPKFQIAGYALYNCEVTYKKWKNYQPREGVNSTNGHYEVTYSASPDSILFFFNSHDGLSIPNGNYTLVSPSILPCSTWVVLDGTSKVGVLRSDEFFADLISEHAYTTIILD